MLFVYVYGLYTITGLVDWTGGLDWWTGLRFFSLKHTIGWLQLVVANTHTVSYYLPFHLRIVHNQCENLVLIAHQMLYLA